MSKYRQAAKVDSNQGEIIGALEKLGCSVIPGHDDILVGFRGVTYWFEIKNPDKVNTKTGKVYNLKPSQKELLETWKGQYHVVWSVEQILAVIGADIKQGD